MRALLVLAWTILAPALAAAQTPVYFSNFADAVTGDNTRRTVVHPNASCPAGDPCYLPDPNPVAASAAIDNYTLDIYERPMGQGSSARDYLPWIDITSSGVGYDATWLYYRIDMYGAQSGSLPSYYSFEINFDADAKGDLLVQTEAPTSKNGTTWGNSGVTAYSDSNNNVGGPRPLLPDGPGNTLGGYETLVFDQGTNNVAGAPGGSTAVRARISPTDPTIVELAVRRTFLVALNGGATLLKASFRPTAAKGAVNGNQFFLHDEYTRGGSGSPYPWLRLAGAPASCPTSLAAENALTTAQRDALDSGTDTPGAPIRLNPCYPASSVYELDNSGSVETLSSGGGLQFQVDMRVTKTAAPSPALRTRPLTYTLTASNLTTGAGQATAVVVTDTLPAGTTFISATPAQGTCNHASGVVTCALGTIANGASTTVAIVVRAPNVLGQLVNAVSITQNETDSVPANNSFSLTTNMVEPPPLVVLKTSAPRNLTGLGGFAVPAEEVIYTIDVSNPDAAVSADTVVVIDNLPAQVEFYNADYDTGLPGTTPVYFEDGAQGSMLACCAAADITYSDDPYGTANPVFDYVPIAGYDPSIHFVRVNPKGTMPAAAGTPPSFKLRFRARIR